MKLLAFVDTHEHPKAFIHLRKLVKAEQPDIALCMGDFTIFGRKTKEMLAQLDTLGLPVVLIHGNHEDEDEILPFLPKHKNLHWAHGQMVDLLGLRFFGFGGGGFSQQEEELEFLEEQLADQFHEKTIVLTHAPPYETALDEVQPGWHVGNESLAALIRRRLPLLVLSGHIHQCFHEHDALHGVPLINPGPDGEIIEVDND
ncbi:MAG: metallophosphoesterase [Candidatus Woesearchaeota archaeon]|nr:metallophosphoesterase [Candidatus Woesearchaeota archaeon]